jgi:hypothetical protein
MSGTRLGFVLSLDLGRPAVSGEPGEEVRGPLDMQNAISGQIVLAGPDRAHGLPARLFAGRDIDKVARSQVLKLADRQPPAVAEAHDQFFLSARKQPVRKTVPQQFPDSQTF